MDSGQDVLPDLFWHCYPVFLLFAILLSTLRPVVHWHWQDLPPDPDAAVSQNFPEPILFPTEFFICHWDKSFVSSCGLRCSGIELQGSHFLAPQSVALEVIWVTDRLTQWVTPFSPTLVTEDTEDPDDSDDIDDHDESYLLTKCDIVERTYIALKDICR